MSTGGRRRATARRAWSLGLLVVALPYVYSSDVEDDFASAGAAEEAHELLRRGSGQVHERGSKKERGGGREREREREERQTEIRESDSEGENASERESDRVSE